MVNVTMLVLIYTMANFLVQTLQYLTDCVPDRDDASVDTTSSERVVGGSEDSELKGVDASVVSVPEGVGTSVYSEVGASVDDEFGALVDSVSEGVDLASGVGASVVSVCVDAVPDEVGASVDPASRVGSSVVGASVDAVPDEVGASVDSLSEGLGVSA